MQLVVTYIDVEIKITLVYLHSPMHGGLVVNIIPVPVVIDVPTVKVNQASKAFLRSYERNSNDMHQV